MSQVWKDIINHFGLLTSYLRPWQKFVHLRLHLLPENLAAALEMGQAMKQILNDIRLLLHEVVVVPLSTAVVVNKTHSLEKAEMTADRRLGHPKDLLDVADACFAKIVQEEEDLETAFVGEALVKPFNVFY